MIATFADAKVQNPAYRAIVFIVKDMSIQLSRATIEQLPIVRDLAHNIWPDTFRTILSEEQINYMLDRMYSIISLEKQATTENNVFILAKDNNSNRYIGFAAYELNFKGSDCCKLHKIYILPEMQGKSIGRLMIDAVKQRAIDSAQQSLLLNVNRHNKATEFYRKIGFTVITEEDIDIGNGYYMNDFVMELKLSL